MKKPNRKAEKIKHSKSLKRNRSNKKNQEAKKQRLSHRVNVAIEARDKYFELLKEKYMESLGIGN